MGRTLQNTMVNLALENACDEATYQVRVIQHASNRNKIKSTHTDAERLPHPQAMAE